MLATCMDCSKSNNIIRGRLSCRFHLVPQNLKNCCSEFKYCRDEITSTSIAVPRVDHHRIVRNYGRWHHLKHLSEFPSQTVSSFKWNIEAVVQCICVRIYPEYSSAEIPKQYIMHIRTYMTAHPLSRNGGEPHVLRPFEWRDKYSYNWQNNAQEVLTWVTLLRR